MVDMQSAGCFDVAGSHLCNRKLGIPRNVYARWWAGHLQQQAHSVYAERPGGNLPLSHGCRVQGPVDEGLPTKYSTRQAIHHENPAGASVVAHLRYGHRQIGGADDAVLHNADVRCDREVRVGKEAREGLDRHGQPLADDDLNLALAL